MKKLIPAILILLICCAGKLMAGILIGSLAPITTASTNTPTFLTNSQSFQIPQISVANNGLAATSAYTGTLQFSVDGTNFFNLPSGPTFNPLTTNAATSVIAAQQVSVPVYFRWAATTNSGNTSTISIGVSSP